MSDYANGQRFHYGFIFHVLFSVREQNKKKISLSLAEKVKIASTEKNRWHEKKYINCRTMLSKFLWKKNKRISSRWVLSNEAESAPFSTDLLKEKQKIGH